MLYYWLYNQVDNWAILNVFRYVTFRSFGAFCTAIFLYFALGKRWISFIKSKQFSQVIREDGPATHQKKKNTPTMGGALIVFCTLISSVLWTQLTNTFVWTAIFVMLAFGLIGFIDDYRKIILKDPKGFRGQYKIVLEIIVALIACEILYATGKLDTTLALPFFKDFHPDLGVAYLFFASVVVIGTANAVNLTDGLDGLVTVPAISSFLSYAILCYAAGNVLISDYLQLPFVPGASEMAIVCAAIMGALMGFLWYNTHPAEIFMGDVGSLAIGGLLGTIALIAKSEVLLVLIGGIFVLEAVSVITQVLSFKLTGKRVFRMAPLHHHFELKGWHESKVIVRFWIISFLLGLVALSTLKLR